MNSLILEEIAAVKKAAKIFANITNQLRQAVLLELANLLKINYAEILIANQLDLARMDPKHPEYDRLLLTKERIFAIAEDVEKVAGFNSPLGKILEEKQLENGILLKKVSVPLGVVAVIYEARPNVTIDVFALCFKAGNGVVLKGGTQAYESNFFFVELIKKSLARHGLSSDIVYLMPAKRETVYELLNAVGLVDVCIPRGSDQLIRFVRENASIPVIETGAGIVHTYFDKSGDVLKGKEIINNAKTRRVSVCNALDTLIIHKDRITELAQLVSLLVNKNVQIWADESSYAALFSHYPDNLLFHAQTSSFGTEFLDFKISIKTVSSLAEALEHIEKYSSKHSEAIIAEDPEAISEFMASVDAAVVYANASTGFTDGGQFGMGAEIGISTQKLHARGPMALPELTSYKWLAYGNGQIRK